MNRLGGGVYYGPIPDTRLVRRLPLFEPSVPTNVIRLDGIKHKELPVEGNVVFDVIEDIFSGERAFSISSSDRYNYAVNTGVILIFDMLTGTQRKLLPKRSNEAKENDLYIGLSLNRGLLVYDQGTLPESKEISLVSIDIENNTYECIGNVYHFLNVAKVDYDICRRNNLVFIRHTYSDDTEMLVFHIDDTFSIKNCQKVPISSDPFLFKPINQGFIFSSIWENSSKLLSLYNFMILNSDNSFTDIENTGVEITSPVLDIPLTYMIGSRCVSSIRNSIHGEWHDSKAFVLYNKIYSKEEDSCVYPLIESSPAILVFELETKIWSKILLNLPLNRAGYLSHVDDNGIFNIVVYTKINDFMECSATSIRIPLKKPEKLLHLCWFQLRTCALSDKFAYLKSLI